MKQKGKLFTACVGGALTILLIFLVRFVDAAPIGAGGTKIGLAHINLFFFEQTGVNMIWYHITDWLGIAAVLTAFIFAVTGFVQLVKRKSLFKVDRELLALGGLYIAVIGLYVLFETVVINYRPIIMPDNTHPEASFPSSHTLIVCIIMGSAFMLMSRYIKNKSLCRVFRLICFIITGVTIVGRLVSGVHWFTDIIGGILISISLLALFSMIISSEDKNENR